MSKIKYIYSHDISMGRFEIKIDPTAGYGYFQHKEYADYSGALWFSGKILDDYDGISFIPKTVVLSLRNSGYTVASEFD
jgi:hypothetical protein